MIDKIRGEYLAICDCCDKELGYFEKFQDAIDSVKSEGWIAKKENDEWTHICDECKI